MTNLIVPSFPRSSQILEEGRLLMIKVKNSKFGGKKAKEDSVQRALKAMGAKCTEDID